MGTTAFAGVDVAQVARRHGRHRLSECKRPPFCGNFNLALPIPREILLDMRTAPQITQTVAGPVLFDPSAMILSAGYAKPFEVAPTKPNGQLYVALANGNMFALVPGYALRSIPGVRDFIGVFGPDNSDAGGRIALSSIVVIGCEVDDVATEASHMMGKRSFN